MKIFNSYIFEPSGLVAKNRIVLAPMTNTQSHEDGILSDDEYHWVVRRAKEGFGIIITCAAHVAKDGQGWPGELGIFSDDHIPGLTRLSEGIHQYGSLGIVQIFHGGARSPENVTGGQPWSASAHTMKAGSHDIDVREATTEDIDGVIQAFTDAAVRAWKAGFDGVELHGAHGYLLHQFISTVTNRREDMWGGSFTNRIRLISTILQNIKKTLPPRFLVGVRLSPEDKYTFQGIDFDESVTLAQMLADDGADYIHLSPWEACKRPDKYPESDKPLITYFREKVKADVPIMVAGEIWLASDAEQVIGYGSDFAALGRAAIGNPDWPSRAKDPAFEPLKPPYTVSHLRQASLSEKFIQYMKKWKGFVDETKV